MCSRRRDGGEWSDIKKLLSNMVIYGNIVPMKGSMVNRAFNRINDNTNRTPGMLFHNC